MEINSRIWGKEKKGVIRGCRLLFITHTVKNWRFPGDKHGELACVIWRWDFRIRLPLKITPESQVGVSIGLMSKSTFWNISIFTPWWNGGPVGYLKIRPNDPEWNYPDPKEPKKPKFKNPNDEIYQ